MIYAVGTLHSDNTWSQLRSVSSVRSVVNSVAGRPQCGLKPKRDAAREIHALQVIGNILLEAISKGIALHLQRFVGPRRQPPQISAQRKVPAEFVFRPAAKIESQQGAVGVDSAIRFMRSAKATRDERSQLPFAVPQHVEEPERILVKVGVERFRVSLRGGVPITETRIVSAPHEFGLRVF